MGERKISLVVMAAGIGSRFGGGIKQLTPVGVSGEIIMDFSIHDAIAAGFDKIVIIIRKDIEKEFREAIGNRLEKVCADHGIELRYAFQDIHDIPAGCHFPEGRTKPWGTGQAVLACKDMIDGPFVTINADDYYGREAFRRLHDFFEEGRDTDPMSSCMAGFILKNTLSDHGTVTRGICEVDSGGRLRKIAETHDIAKTPGGASVNGRALDPSSHVSMNMWGFTAGFMRSLDEGFTEFYRKLENGGADPMKAEFLIPEYVGQLLEEDRITVSVLETGDRWFGVTYKEDAPAVQEAFRKLTEEGVYRADLYSDL